MEFCLNQTFLNLYSFMYSLITISSEGDTAANQMKLAVLILEVKTDGRTQTNKAVLYCHRLF